MASKMLLEINPWFNVEVMDDDLDFRIYHSKMELMDSGWSGVEARRGQTQIDPHTPLPPVLDLVLNIKGVVWAMITPYTVRVRKETIFPWDDIHNDIAIIWLGIKQAIEECSYDPRQQI